MPVFGLQVLGVVAGGAVALPEEVHVPVELVGPLPGHDVVDGAREVAVLRGGAQGEDLDLLDGVHVGLGRALVEEVFGDVHPVELEGVLVVGRAIDHASPAAVPPVQGAGGRVHEVEERVAAKGRVLHPGAIVVGADLVGGGVHHSGLRHYGDLFLERAHLEADALIDLLAEAHSKARASHRLESGETEGDLVLPGGQVQDAIKTQLVARWRTARRPRWRRSQSRPLPAEPPRKCP